MDDKQTKQLAAQYISDWPSSNEDEWRRAAATLEVTNVELFVQTAAKVQDFRRSALARKFQSDVDRWQG